MEMRKNLSNPERIGRAILSLLLTGVALKKGGKLAVLLAFAAGDIMGSAISAYCPLCEILGLHGSSCECGSSSG